MIGKDAERRWSIGELAGATGSTVRALRHYDEIGLLRASERTAYGHRRYTAADVRRLYRLRALRGLGLSLEEIAGVLADDDPLAMRGLLAAQLRELDGQAEQIGRVRDRVHELLRRLETGEMPEPDQFMTTLELMSVFETSFTPEQRERLAARRAELGPEAIEAAKSRWSELVEQLLGHVRAGTPVEDPEVRDLVRRWDEIGAMFHSGDGDTEDRARRMWQDHGTDLAQALPWSAEDMSGLVAYLERARRS